MLDFKINNDIFYIFNYNADNLNFKEDLWH